ncbi:hypothetical protein [Roseicyclus mahoneyensis]|uniref:Uncharacterized protein n=1 Tax=Roseicyclus mahoneyensis TaxID=164332 RepID=A0A316GDY1_9RHOB|nr:hypothetical protein [Roseicyclus mahoneyensis]PWK59098.1 hypothetical protein C7455_10920 [Roseicyclus mahoneyensis]
MRLCIAGAGPAGMLAALIGQAAGWRILWQGDGRDSPQAAHLHLVRDVIGPTLTSIDADLGARIAAATDPAHDWRDAGGKTGRAPRLTREGLTAALAAACAARGLAALTTPLPAPGDGAELWIDATGGARALARRFEAATLGSLTLDDIGTGRLWRSEQWHDRMPSAPYTQVVPGRAYLESGPDGTRRTGLDGATEALAGPDKTPVVVSRMVAPPVRLARWKGAAGAPALILFGDARLQTPPDMGFGLLAVAQQAVILHEALTSRSDPERPLAGWAETVWVNAGMQLAFAC